MYIIQDKRNKEYGLLKKTPFIDVMKASLKKYNKDHHKLTPEHVFFDTILFIKLMKRLKIGQQKF